MALLTAMFMGADGAPLTVYILAIIIAPVAALVVLPLMLPATLAALVIVNRWKIENGAVLGMIAAGLACLTVLPFLFIQFDASRPEWWGKGWP